MAEPPEDVITAAMQAYEKVRWERSPETAEWHREALRAALAAALAAASQGEGGRGVETRWFCRFADGIESSGWADRADVERAIASGLCWNDDPKNPAVAAVPYWRHAPSEWVEGEPPPAPPAVQGGGGRTIQDLIEASSLGEPDAVAARALVTDEQVREVMARLRAADATPLPDAVRDAGRVAFQQAQDTGGSWMAFTEDVATEVGYRAGCAAAGPGGGLDREALAEVCVTFERAAEAAEAVADISAHNQTSELFIRCSAEARAWRNALAALAPLLTGGGRDG